MRVDDGRSRYDNKHFLFGLFFSFGNRLQAAGDAFYDEITSKNKGLESMMLIDDKDLDNVAQFT